MQITYWRRHELLISYSGVVFTCGIVELFKSSVGQQTHLRKSSFKTPMIFMILLKNTILQCLQSRVPLVSGWDHESLDVLFFQFSDD